MANGNLNPGGVSGFLTNWDTQRLIDGNFVFGSAGYGTTVVAAVAWSMSGSSSKISAVHRWSPTMVGM